MKYILLKDFKGWHKEHFLEEMAYLWDKFEEIGIDKIIGFKAYCGKPIEVKTILEDRR